MPIERPRPRQRRIDTGHVGDGAQLTQLTLDAVQVSAIAAKHARADFTSLARDRGGEYDGWRAWL